MRFNHIIYKALKGELNGKICVMEYMGELMRDAKNYPSDFFHVNLNIPRE